MPLKLNLVVPNKAVHLFIGVVLITVLVAYVYAYTFPPAFLGHGGDNVWINTTAGEMDLQTAINSGLFGGGGMAFGTWDDRDEDGFPDTVSDGQLYTAATDGIVVAIGYNSVGNMFIKGYTNGTKVVGTGEVFTPVDRSITFPVKKGDTWEVTFTYNITASVTVRWLPLVPAGGGGGDITAVNGGDGLTPDSCLSGDCTLNIDTGTTTTTGLEIVSDEVRLMNNGCSAGEVLKRNATNTGWQCVADNTGIAGGMRIQSGKVAKPGLTVTVTFPEAFSGTPNVVISSQLAAGGMGDWDRITAITATSFTVTSLNANPIYYVQWIAIGPA